MKTILLILTLFSFTSFGQTFGSIELGQRDSYYTLYWQNKEYKLIVDPTVFVFSKDDIEGLTGTMIEALETEDGYFDYSTLTFRRFNFSSDVYIYKGTAYTTLGQADFNDLLIEIKGL